MTGYIKLRKRALEILHTELSEKLFYHGPHHTLDVLKVCNDYLRRQKINGRSAKLLRIGALLHDIGFTISNHNHEEHSVEIARKLMKECGFSNADFKVVKGLILATRIPQRPQNNLEKILCDSDLDYLGKSNFQPISNYLFKELQAYDIITDKNDWNMVQIKFLEAHEYHTEFARKNRQPEKLKRIEELKWVVEKTRKDPEK